MAGDIRGIEFKGDVLRREAMERQAFAVIEILAAWGKHIEFENRSAARRGRPYKGAKYLREMRQDVAA